MTNTQFLISIGVSIIFNGFIIGMIFGALSRIMGRIEDKVDLLIARIEGLR